MEARTRVVVVCICLFLPLGVSLAHTEEEEGTPTTVTAHLHVDDATAPSVVGRDPITLRLDTPRSLVSRYLHLRPYHSLVSTDVSMALEKANRMLIYEGDVNGQEGSWARVVFAASAQGQRTGRVVVDGVYEVDGERVTLASSPNGKIEQTVVFIPRAAMAEEITVLPISVVADSRFDTLQSSNGKDTTTAMLEIVAMLDGVFQRDLAKRLFVNGTLVFSDSASDPFSDDEQSAFTFITIVSAAMSGTSSIAALHGAWGAVHVFTSRTFTTTPEPENAKGQISSPQASCSPPNFDLAASFSNHQASDTTQFSAHKVALQLCRTFGDAVDGSGTMIMHPLAQESDLTFAFSSTSQTNINPILNSCPKAAPYTSIFPVRGDEKGGAVVTLTFADPPSSSVTFPRCRFYGAFQPATQASTNSYTCTAPPRSQTGLSNSVGTSIVLTAREAVLLPDNEVTFQYHESIEVTKVEPTSGRSGDEVEITGVGFFNAPGDDLRCYFGPNAWTRATYHRSTLLECTVPEGIEPQAGLVVSVSVNGGSEKTAVESMTFTVEKEKSTDHSILIIIISICAALVIFPLIVFLALWHAKRRQKRDQNTESRRTHEQSTDTVMEMSSTSGSQTSLKQRATKAGGDLSFSASGEGTSV
eukprot:TRINITY_DN509_c1_g2_i1.p1 TRINITY_DN509_c1_g2~~TRINITY_DN509_c1_g2_i1.p1  ORF type:complete len:659 (+),score=110.09 TRINITY_DN509_c1_g2_i1:49-1977(+)